MSVEGVATPMPEPVLDGWADGPAWGPDQVDSYCERLGIGDELGMAPEEAERIARREASLSILPSDTSAGSLDLVRCAIDLFGPAPVAPVGGDPGPGAVPPPPPHRVAAVAAPTPLDEPASLPPAARTPVPAARPPIPPARPMTVTVSDHPPYPPGLFPDRHEEGYGPRHR